MNRLFEAVPYERVARLRAAIYAVVLLDVWLLTPFPIGHGNVPADLYQPLPVREWFFPQPAPLYVHLLRIVITVAALLALSGRLPRAAGLIVAVGMFDWMSNAFSYSKINHDHLALLVALAVLPLGAGRRSDSRADAERNGWSLRMIQIAVVATYFFAAVAKVKEAGWGWASSAVLVWAITRRGSAAGQALAELPWLTYLFQWISLIAEFLAPIMLLLRGRPLYAYVAFWAVFHASTFALLGIHFLPTAICLLAFLPLERLAIGPRGRPEPQSVASG
ncbi:HTTM domain-containing protein [Yimella sp. cx-51]|uniref:HTTM domain-containing protein n=1 Tax=Yimella sp. cx-51 TaxID=2770551 RepID=UPI00165EA150|nr:HTTM domain-containing protein [Yimella sp. cx-51]MBC9955833.1 HTTM domain-containing protein [Yimella sp. cx-51]QTH37617.1 HTTM domain-containing protein [Yimella sp. cx-51]